MSKLVNAPVQVPILMAHDPKVMDNQWQRWYLDLVTQVNALTLNGRLSFSATDNTHIKISYTGSDGVVRTNTLTLS